MNIPGYDDWVLRGPEEHISVIMETCEACKGMCQVEDADGFPQDCDECGGTGEVEVTLDEPDGDYLYERERDRRMEE